MFRMVHIFPSLRFRIPHVCIIIRVVVPNPYFFNRAKQARTAVVSRGYYRCERCLRLITAECKRLIVTRCLYLELNALCFHHINRKIIGKDYCYEIILTAQKLWTRENS